MPKTYTIELLEWEVINGGEEERARTPFDTYYVGISISGACFCESDNFTKHCSSLEAAKQAAQSHWEERLKGALAEVEG